MWHVHIVTKPPGQVGGNEQFNMMADQYFAYDSSITAPLSRVPIWPYTLQYRFVVLSYS